MMKIHFQITLSVFVITDGEGEMSCAISVIQTRPSVICINNEAETASEAVKCDNKSGQRKVYNLFKDVNSLLSEAYKLSAKFSNCL